MYMGKGVEKHLIEEFHSSWHRASTIMCTLLLTRRSEPLIPFSQVSLGLRTFPSDTYIVESIGGSQQCEELYRKSIESDDSDERSVYLRKFDSDAIPMLKLFRHVV